jgi:hypothetical protein
MTQASYETWFSALPSHHDEHLQSFECIKCQLCNVEMAFLQLYR